MFRYLNHSLLLRAGLAMGLVTMLAVSGMASAIFVARTTYGEAAAVNQAGSLRMQSYRIAAALEAMRNDGSTPFGEIKRLTTEFQNRLVNPRLTDVVNNTQRKSIHKAYQLISDQWRLTLLPRLKGYLERRTDPTAGLSLDEPLQVYRFVVGAFVVNIDNLVQRLEEDAESRIHLLGVFQGISLFLTLMVAIVTLYLLYTDVLSPLHDMLNATERTGSGDFTARIASTGADELGRLGRAFNTMAADLSKMYGALEERVAEKTRKLTQRNQSLELLYSATQYLTEAPVSEQTYQKLLDEIIRVVDIGGITLCRKDEKQDHARRIARNGLIPPMCKSENCNLCLNNGQTRMIGSAEHAGTTEILSVPVGDQGNINGVLLVEMRAEKALEPWQIQLLETLGKHIGISVDVTRRVTQRRRLALLEERGVIARELHDSLAQSLTYLKIQVSRLSLLTRSGAEHSPVDDALAELKGGLDTAYRHLRELLTTFRLQMDGDGLGSALAKTVEEFNARSETEIQLDNRIKNSPFTVNEEIHVLQIVREALSNIIHHSRATQAWVSLAFEDEKSILICVEDNGIGIPQRAHRTHHYGLTIMRERTNLLRGNLHIEAQEQGGTRVCLRLQQATTRQSHLSPQKEAMT